LRDENKIVLLATHDLTNLAQRFDQVLCINHHVCACGPPEEAFTHDVLEELYGSHGIEFDQNHYRPTGRMP
jgi:ABC-type Mn2+/Zn2+ transport system ATPase subunit